MIPINQNYSFYDLPHEVTQLILEQTGHVKTEQVCKLWLDVNLQSIYPSIIQGFENDLKEDQIKSFYEVIKGIKQIDVQTLEPKEKLKSLFQYLKQNIKPNVSIQGLLNLTKLKELYQQMKKNQQKAFIAIQRRSNEPVLAA